MTSDNQKTRLSLTFDAAALNPELWRDACQQISDYIGGEGALLAADDIGYDAGMLPHSDGLGAFVERYYAERWYEDDVRGARGWAVAYRQGWVSDHMILSEAEMREHRFYREFVRPSGLFFFGTTAVKVGDRIWGLSVQRTAAQGPFQLEDLHRLAEFRGHLRLAIRRSGALGGRRVETLEHILSRARHGVAVLDVGGRVTRLNARAEQWLREAEVLRGGRIVPPDGKGGEALRRILGAATDPEGRGHLLLPPPATIQSRDGKALLVDIVPMPRDFASVAARAAAILNIRPLPTLADQSPSWEERFGLTPRETEVSALIALGAGPDAIASRLGLSVATVRQHLKAIFRKTGTHRQSELVAALSGQIRG